MMGPIDSVVNLRNNMITEQQGEDQVKKNRTIQPEEIQSDIEWFRGRLEKAKARGDDASAQKLEKQISLLEDAVVIYRLSRPASEQSELPMTDSISNTKNNMITERQGEGQVDIEADIAHLRKNLEIAKSAGNLERVDKLERQISLLEDAVVIYRLDSSRVTTVTVDNLEESLIQAQIDDHPERRTFYIDLGTLPPAKANQMVNDIRQRVKGPRES